MERKSLRRGVLGQVGSLSEEDQANLARLLALQGRLAALQEKMRGERPFLM